MFCPPFRRWKQLLVFSLLMTTLYLYSYFYFDTKIECEFDDFDGDLEFENDIEFGNSSNQYEINTEGCRIPLLQPFNSDFNFATFKNHTNQELPCNYDSKKLNPLNIEISRFNYSFVKVRAPDGVQCVSREILRPSDNGDQYEFGVVNLVWSDHVTPLTSDVTEFPGRYVIQVECVDGAINYTKVCSKTKKYLKIQGVLKLN